MNKLIIGLALSGLAINANAYTPRVCDYVSEVYNSFIESRKEIGSTYQEAIKTIIDLNKSKDISNDELMVYSQAAIIAYGKSPLSTYKMYKLCLEWNINE